MILRETVTWNNFNRLDGPFLWIIFAGNLQSFEACFDYSVIFYITWREIFCSFLVVDYLDMAIENAKNDILFEIFKVCFSVLEIIKSFFIQIDSGFWCFIFTKIENPIESAT